MKYAVPNISFKYNGVPLEELSYTSETTENSITRRFEDGLEVKTVWKKFEKQGVIWWTNYFTNTSDRETGIISELFDGDITFDMDPDPVPVRKNRQSTWEYETFQLIETKGGDGTYDDYLPLPTRLWENSNEFKSNCKAGRSALGRAPYFDLNRKDEGALIAVGWSGQWHAFTKRNHDSVRFRCGIENTNFKMLPGESFRTASVAVLFYDKGRDEAHNRWRSFMREIGPLGGKGRGENIPFSAIMWGGIPTDELLRRWKQLLDDKKFPFETCWIDAGWYEPLREMTTADQSRVWPLIGKWEVNKFYHPDEYRDFVKFLHDRNKTFMVWFEPERVNRLCCVWTDQLLVPGADRNDNIIALNQDNVREQIIKRFGDLIESMGVDIYRQDYNIAPEEWWRTNETEDRKGMIEILYINNLYRYWDALLARFPHLLIDNCAGGGHRNDIELLSRAVPMWRSDFQCIWDVLPEGNQIQTESSANWIPYTGLGYGPTLGDLYSWRSAYASGITVRTWEHVDPEWEVGASNEPFDWAKKYFDEYMSVRDYFSKDYYPLLPPSKENTTWQASQYIDPDTEKGIVIAYRRAMCPCETVHLEVKGFNPEKTYVFTDEDTGKMFRKSGKELLSEGIDITLKEKRSSALIKFAPEV